MPRTATCWAAHWELIAMRQFTASHKKIHRWRRSTTTLVRLREIL